MTAHLQSLRKPPEKVRCPAVPIVLMGLLTSGGCALHTSGVVQRTGDEVSLLTPEGSTLRLRLLTEDVRPVARLEDHLVEVEGLRGPGGLRVTDYRVHQGLHDMSAWVGVLEPLGLQVAIQDRTSKATYILAEDSADTLRVHLGEPVLLEGYVEGPHLIRVMFFRVLSEETSP